VLIVVTLLVSWKVTLARLEQRKNALVPMVRTLFGIVMLPNLIQLWNAARPILVTLLVSWKVTPVKLVQFWNAL
jgi:hypothetical protein